MHPNGNIAEFLCSAGLAKVIDVSVINGITGTHGYCHKRCC
jgi:hypothetical protein